MIEHAREDHYNVFKKPDIATMRYPTYKPEPPCNLDSVVQYFKFNELSKTQSLLSKWLPKNPYKNDFDRFVEDFMESHKQLPEEEALRKLYAVLENKQNVALASLKVAVL
jgi:hypothetical protein